MNYGLGSVGPMLAACAVVAGCSSDPVPTPEIAGGWLADPLAPFPAFFSEVGLYTDPGRWEHVSQAAIYYEPLWPLWSNGSDKRRFLVLPAGRQIRNDSPEAWVFPVGTLFIKTFSYPSTATTERHIESRLLVRREDRWDYAAYLWDPDASDARFLSLDDAIAVDVTLENETSFTHDVPAKDQCRMCHESPATPVLGFNEIDLNSRLDASANTQVDVLFSAGALLQPPPDPAESIAAPDEVTRQVLGYFQGNCVHCHDGGDGPSSSFDLRHRVALDNLIGQPTDSSASATGIRVVPSCADQSILYQALSGESPDPEVKLMPPVGVQRRDAAAIEMLREWINSLPGNGCSL